MILRKQKTDSLKNALGGLFPAKLTPVMIELSGINPEKKVNEVSREERLGFVELIKNLPLTVTGLRDYNEAIITKGGIKVKEINPSTMESKLVNGLYFAGEVLGSGCSIREVQSADSMVHRISGRNKCSGLMILKTI